MQWIPRKIVVWGIGIDYDTILNQIQFEILKNNLICEALVCQDKDAYASKKDNFPIIKKSEFHNLNFDYLVISSVRHYDEIKKEALKIGGGWIKPSQIIDGQIFTQPLFDFRRYISLIENPVTILSNDCWGGYAYNRLKLPFASPLINILWDMDQYVKFIQKPFFYLDTPLQMVREGDLHKGICPLGKLGTNDDYVELRFVHNYNFSTALEQWNRRIKRINRNNIFIKMGFPNSAEAEEKREWIRAFENLTCKKILFYNGEEDIPRIFNQANGRFIWRQMSADSVNYFDYNNFLRNEYFRDVDLLKMLTGGDDYSRY